MIIKPWLTHNFFRDKLILKEQEKRFIHFLGQSYKSELDSNQDERQRMILQYKGKYLFVKEWISEKTQLHHEFRDLLVDMEAQPAYYKSLLSQEEDSVVQSYDPPEVKRTKHDMAEQKKKQDSMKRDIEKLSKHLTSLQEELKVTDKKLGEVQLLLSAA